MNLEFGGSSRNERKEERHHDEDPNLKKEKGIWRNW